MKTKEALMRSRIALVLLIGLVLLGRTKNVSAATTINVTNSGMTAWLFNGAGPNQTLSLTRGQTYNLVVSATGHPFHITTVPGIAPVQDLVDPGLSGNGTANGTVVFTPSASTPASFSYQCSVHAAMTGTINLVAAAAVPAVGTWSLVAFGALVLAVGTVAIRRRRRS
jgi:hypothetical protein